MYDTAICGYDAVEGSLAYDNNGNSQSKTDSTGTTSYTWDFENRMTSVTLPGSGGTVTFKYDPFGRRIYKSSSSGTSIYAYDGDNLVEETNSSGAVVARYEDTQNIDEPLAMLRSGATTYRHADHLGTSRFASTPARTMYSDTAYSAFGEPYAQSGTADASFTGQDQDTTAGVYDFLYRKYDPGQSRWISPDPRGNAAANPTLPQSWNRYAYVMNSPLSAVDPLGLNCVWDDGSYDAQDDPDTHTQPLCEDAGGTWFAGDMGGGWSPDPNAYWAEQAATYNGTGSAIPVISLTVWVPSDTSLQGSILEKMADPNQCADCANILNGNASALNNPLTYVEWFGFSALGGTIYAAPEVAAAIIETGQAAEAAVPGLTEVTIDIINVVGPIPSLGATLPGLLYNGSQIGSQLYDACFGNGNCIKTGWYWFNGDEVNAPDRP